MKLALISDVHGNLFALEAVLAELEHEEPDGLVCLGDIAFGPQGSECLARVRALGCPVVQGNWDAWFLHGIPTLPEESGVLLEEIGAWWAAALSEDDRAFLGTFVSTHELELGGRSVLCFHGSPHSYDDRILATTPEDELRAMLDGRRADVLVGGHTHLQLLRRVEHGLLLNPGAVGMAFTAWWTERVRVAPWAEYALVSADRGRLEVDLRRTDYDVDALLELSLGSGMPHARWWADSWLLDLH